MNDITVRFFARLREQLGVDRITLSEPNLPASVDQALARVVERGDRHWAEALADENLVIAVNQRVSSRAAELRPGDELALFPPVTGG